MNKYQKAIHNLLYNELQETNIDKELAKLLIAVALERELTATNFFGTKEKHDIVLTDKEKELLIEIIFDYYTGYDSLDDIPLYVESFINVINNYENFNAWHDFYYDEKTSTLCYEEITDEFLELKEYQSNKTI